ncbi:MAG: hypothetical protein ACYDCL_03065 [Myxococcales bacterium]
MLATSVLAVTGLLWLLSSLDSRWVKQRLLAGLYRATGLELDYRNLEIHPLSGLRIDDLDLRTPEPFRAVAPDLVRIGTARVAWHFGRHPRAAPWIDSVVLHGLAISLVQGADGRSSLTALLPASPPAPRPKQETPLSQLPATIFDGRAPVGLVTVEGVSLSFHRLDSGRTVEQLELGGLSVAVQTAPTSPPGGWRLLAKVGGDGAQATAVRREREGSAPESAHIELRLEVQGSTTEAAARVDARLVDQSFLRLSFAQDALDELLHLEASARFDSRRGLTEVVLANARLADGALAAEARAELPDGPSLAVRLPELSGTANLARLVALVPVSDLPGCSTLMETRCDKSLSTGSLRFSGRDVLFSSRNVSGTIEMEGKVGKLSLKLPAVSLSAERAEVSLRAEPAWGSDGLSLDLRSKASLRGGTLESGDQRMEIDRLDSDAHFAELRIDPLHLPATTGRGEITLRATAREARGRHPLVAADGLAARLSLRLAARDTGSADLELPIERLRLFGAGGRLLFGGPLRLEGHLSDAAIDLMQPLESVASAKLDLSTGALRLAAEGHAARGTVDFDLSAASPTLAQVAPLVPKSVGLPWRRMSLEMKAKGRLEGLAGDALHLQQRTEIQVGHPALAALHGSADALALTVSSAGDLHKQTVDTDVVFRGLKYAGKRLDDGHLSSEAQADLGARSLHVRLGAGGAAFPRTALNAALAFAPDGRTVSCDIEGEVGRLGALRSVLTSAPLLSTETNLDDLAISLKAHGSVSGLLEWTGSMPRPSGRPLTALQGMGSAKLHLSRLQIGQPKWSVAAPSVDVQLDARAEGESTRVHGDLALDALDARVANHEVRVRGLHDGFDARLEGDPLKGFGELSNHLAAADLRQDLAPEVTPEDLTLRLAVARGADGTVQLSRLELESLAGGTKASLAGALVLGEQRHKLSLRGELSQDLARLSGAPASFSGRGQLSVALRVASPDLELFRTQATVRVRGADVQLPASRFVARSIDGEIPMSADLSMAGGSLHFLRDAETNPYSQLRFADQHPLLSNSGFISVASLSTPQLEVAPLYGNLRIERNQASLSQLEVGVRGGRVSGQCLLDWEGEDSTLQARIRATGVLSSHGEPFDGSASLVASLRDRSIDGHAEIVRIGRRHLLDLLDVQDPQRVDPAINRIRRALALGYPDRVRLLFDHGFASVLVKLGGAGSLIKIDELRGIPTEPILDHVIASLTQPAEEP